MNERRATLAAQRESLAARAQLHRLQLRYDTLALRAAIHRPGAAFSLGARALAAAVRIARDFAQ